jgi:predicted RNA binding protein YcfA (HicA-like mRNA interferase family)
MSKFPIDAPIKKVIKALEQLGFEKIREGNHIAMLRQDRNGTKIPLTMPNHPNILKVQHFVPLLPKQAFQEMIS